MYFVYLFNGSRLLFVEDNYSR